MEDYRAKFMCSFGGEIQPRTHDNQLSYVGGHNKILYVDRSVNFPALLAELSALFDAAGVVSFKYQLPGEDLDTLVSVTNDNDLHNMMLEYDHLHRASPTRARMRLFLFFPNNPPSERVVGSDLNPNHPLEVQQLQRVVDRASSSSSCSFGPSIPGKYDVFINFRGEDTRTKFTCHLHEALSRKQVRTFIDYELDKGDEISPSLFRAIEDSYVSVVVFSENYASSKWCLEELVKILECRKEREQVVIPVFYEIDPPHVRKHVGSYKEAFEKHEQNYLVSKEKVQRWKDALTEAADLAGWDSRSRSYRDDLELIQKIVKDVLEKLNYRYPYHNFGTLVGICKNSVPLELLVGEARSVGIWGIGGIGKTTIARYIFDKISCQYDASCFLENVRERSGKHGEGLHKLRNQLYSNLLRDNIHQSRTEKTTFVDYRLHRQRNFIVLDDVSCSKQVEYLVGELQSYDPGSRIIITTRDKSLLQNRRVEKIYEVEGLDLQESLTLFSLNAFNEDCPEIGYKELSRRAVFYCKGVPLALTVLGSFLHSKSETEWDCMLQKLKKIPYERVQNVLRLSYDGLNYEEKQIFLDVACFFKGKPKGHVIELLDNFGFYAVIGLRSLLDKALIKIQFGIVSMHALIQQIGWEIVRQESILNPGNRSRLWDFDDIYDVLKNNKGTNAIQGMMFDLSQRQQKLCLSADTFKKMPELRFLKVFMTGKPNKSLDLQFPMGLDSISNKLRCLEWSLYPLQSLPSSFCPEMLVTLRLWSDQLKRLWGGVQNLVNLREVSLAGCTELMELPDFSKAQNLKRVHLSSCRSLQLVHPSILSLDTLEYLDLQDCVNLKMLESENHFRSLWHLNVQDCYSLMKLSLSSERIKFLELESVGVVKGLSIGRFSKLVTLNVIGCRFENLLKDLSCLKSLQKLSVTSCEGVNSNQDMCIIFEGLQSLRELDLKDCHDLFELPNNLSCLSSLEKLVLDGSHLEKLPESIKHLSRLETLSLQNCRWLGSLPKLPSSIICLDALNCALLWTVASSSMNPKPEEQQCESISFRQYLRELAHGYESRRRGGGMKAIFWPNSFSICYPGCRIPEWFTYRTTGRSITFELIHPSDQYSSFLLCIVLSTYCTHQMYGGLYIQYRCWEDGNMHKYSTGAFSLDDTMEEKDSDHVYMSFDGLEILEALELDTVNNQSASYSCNPKVTLEFYGVCGVTKWNPDNDLLIKECGVYPIMAPDCCIQQMELEFGMKNKRHWDVLEIGSSNDQGPYPTNKVKEF